MVLCAITSAAAAGETNLNGHVFTLPDGFEIQLVAGPPLVERPISADFDELGRLYVSDSSGSNDPVKQQLEDRPHRIVRLEDTNGDGVFDASTVFAEGMMFPEGTMWLDGSLYVAAPPSIWKLTDTNDDGVADERSEWFQGKTLGGCANDLHGPYLGPDGWIYWCKGGFVEQEYVLRGKPWKSRAAHIYRCLPDGTGFEPVMTGGMDNPVDVAFLPTGERFFTTTFLVHPGNGQRDGLIHAIYGGVYGKLQGAIEGHPRTGELMPVLSHFGAAAPCGLHRYESSTFGGEYRDNLFACQFNLHKVSRHVLEQSGGSYQSRDSDFVVSNNMDFRPTDVIEDADGSLLVVDTGGWYKLCCPTSQLWKPDVTGAIYRIRRTGAKPPDDPRGQSIAWNSLRPAQLVERFSDLPRFDSTNHESARELALIWACIQIDSPDSRAVIRQALTHHDATCRQAALHGVSLLRDTEAMSALVDLLKSGTPADARAAAETLGRIGDTSVVPRLLAAAESAADRAVEHSIIYALIELADPAATAKGLAGGSPRRQRAAMIALDQMSAGGLKPEDVSPHLALADPLLQETAQWIVSHRPEWGAALAGWCSDRLSKLADGAPEAQAVQLESQLVQFSGHGVIQDLLAASATQAALPPSTRLLVLRAMAKAKPKELPAVWADAIASLVTAKDASLSAAALAVVRSLPEQKDPPKKLNDALLAVATDTGAATQTRLEAMAAVLGGMREVSADQLERLLSSLSLDQPLPARTAAADALSRARLKPQQSEQLIAALKTVGPLEIDRALGPFERSADDALALKLLTSLREASALPSLRFDLLRQKLVKYSPSVQQEIDALESLVHVDAAQQRARIAELLPAIDSGDVRRGQAVFNSSKSNCTACHRFGYLGGSTGPDLTRIGRIRTERDLLEAVLYPSISFVHGFEPVLVATVDGRMVNGLVRDETATDVLLATGPNQEVRLRHEEIDQRQPSAVSIMPAGLDQQLTVQELIDLVAFLKNAK
ncbi:MAG: c-type cytochrome [Planctomycetes bacterium]|nr:c-type cytochrome [Planctomycetota bacterium]